MEKATMHRVRRAIIIPCIVWNAIHPVNPIAVKLIGSRAVGGIYRS